MSVARGVRRFVSSLLPLSILLCSVCLHAEDKKAAEPQTYPQIVRVSFVEGDVRVSRGKECEKATGAAWEKAAVDLPLASGFNLVTGEGRAVLEFEDASMAYLAPNSVLEFVELSATDGVPRTEMNLLSGTMTVNVVTEFAGESFIVKSPTDEMGIRYPMRTYARVDSFLDAMRITSMAKELSLGWGRGLRHLDNGQSILLSHGKILPSSTIADAAFDTTTGPGWDAWVNAKVDDHNAALLSAMKDAGLSQPIPGLVEMAARGSFFDCDEGRCWEPTGGWHPGDKQTAAPVKASVETRGHMVLASYSRDSGEVASQMQASGMQAQGIDPLTFEDDDPFFPCDPYRIRSWYAQDPMTLRMRLVSTELIGSPFAYEWGVCHAGGWEYRGRHYVWAAGTKRHHRCPVRWVKNGSTRGYVPLHLKDERGKEPLNLKHGLYETKNWKQGAVERVAFDHTKPVSVLSGPPKEFLRTTFMPLGRVEAPKLEARSVMPHEALPEPGRKGDAVVQRPQTVALKFDHKAQSFSAPHEVMQGGKMTTVSAPIGSRGAGGPGGGGEFHGGGSASGGGSRGGGGSSGSGGASHASGGGGSAGGGGGSHGGGGGSSGGGGTSGGGAHK